MEAVEAVEFSEVGEAEAASDKAAATRSDLRIASSDRNEELASGLQVARQPTYLYAERAGVFFIRKFYFS